MDAPLYPTGSNTSAHNIPGLDPASYTAHKLKHSNPEHLHLTSRRFFIGPIPEGWLSSNRKSWYRRRLELSSYSSQSATFHAAEGQAHHPRTLTSLDRAQGHLSFSFPQPEDVDDAPSDQSDSARDTEEDTEDEFFEPQELQPVSTETQQPDLQESETTNTLLKSPSGQLKKVPSHNLDGLSGVEPTAARSAESPSSAAKPDPASTSRVQIQINGTPAKQSKSNSDEAGSPEFRYSVSDTQGSSVRQHGLDAQHDDIEAGSRTRLISPSRSPTRATKSRDGAKSLHREDPTPMSQQSNHPPVLPHQSTGVRFRVAEAVEDRQRRAGVRADHARHRIGRKLTRRQTLQAGTIIKMEKMLVRADVTRQQVPDTFDENDSIKVDTQLVEKWKEFMVVARKSAKADDDDFRLQFYNTRVIPEIEDASTRKKPSREIKLIRKSTHVNLYSSLDKSVVIWHPYKKGTRIMILRCESTAHSVEWYTFLRDALGWKRPDMLQVSVPDLDVVLQIEKPFENLKVASDDEDDEDAALEKAIEAEQAVAGKIVSQCLDMLKGNSEWADVIQKWSGTYKPGLAWKRYDRLEWIHGVNEQKMYGSMAMQQSYELELRPKIHYPMHAFGEKGKEHDEPAPIEGFLIRMTSQTGVHRRMGKTFFKRLYFSTQDHLLVFNRPAQATPPHPPRLQTIGGSNVPSAREIVEKTPIMYDIDPFPLEGSAENQRIKWLASGSKELMERSDREAYEEARRNQVNLAESDGYINMTRIRTVRIMQWGTDAVDETLSSGSDVDFHESVRDTVREDGTTTSIDDNRVFELILDNGLVVRLQAYDNRTRDEWISRLKKLVKYWKLRKRADMDIFKSVRATNLHMLQIDEDVEAELGQFGRKWEVTRSEASPQLYNICAISSCRTISLAGLLYRKLRRHGTFQRCSVVLAGGQLLIYQSTLRRSSGEQIPHVHQEKQQVINLRGCYVYSGLIVEDDLLYQNRTFDANHIGTMASLPRVWTEDGWTSTDVDVMCCFVVWMNTRKGWFRTAGSQAPNTDEDRAGNAQGGKRAKLKRVRQLGVPGRGIVFKCRSRAERDLWVLNLGIEIERLVEKQRWEEEEEGGGVRLAS